MTRILAAILALSLAAPLRAEVAPALWDACIAAPDPACALSLALAEIDADPAGDHDYPLRRLSEVLLAAGQTAGAAAMVRRITDPVAALYLWPDVLARRPDPADVTLAADLAAGQDSAYSAAMDRAQIARALVTAGNLAGAAALIDGITDDRAKGGALAALAGAQARSGDLAAAEATVAAIADGGWQFQARVDVLTARAEAGDLDAVLAGMEDIAGGNPVVLGLRLVPLALSPALNDRLAGELTAPPWGVEYPERHGEDLGQALAAAPADFAATETLRLTPALPAPEIAASLLIPVLAATADPDVAAAAIAAADAIADPVMQALARLDMAPHLAGAPDVLARWADALPLPPDRAYMTAQFAIATGDAGLAMQAVALLPAIADDYDRDESFEPMIAAVAAGSAPGRVPELLAAYDTSEPRRDDAILGAVSAMAAAGEAEAALTLARSMTYDERQAQALGRIGAVRHDTAVLAEALALTRQVSSIDYRIRALTGIGEAMLQASE